ncbi:TonB-dependent receptor [Massilia timonae]|uniref:TonB-dependent Receptor Plug domain protein n=1 Tax=Massilia timonae TaxID=47229 RepID=A0A1S2NBU6_9BURK|nr:TonB-dependent receptor [Massilia timonae]OIJ42469.1 tonB-dependent Receptor Plug domain protein [Massilia timonae]
MIRIDHLTKRYGERTVVNDLNLHVRAIPHAVMLTCALAAPALAEDMAAAASADPAQVVEVKGQRSEDERLAPGTGARSLPGGVTTVTSEDLATLDIGRDISNVFRRVPGVVANNIDQGDTGNGFRMRGFATQGTHGADTAIYIDGVPQNIPSSQGGAGHGPAFLEWMTGDMIDTIDVIKGPVSALFGDQNRAGAVAIRTREGGAATPSSATVTVESYGGRRGSLVLSGEHGKLRSLVVADRYSLDGFRHGAFTDRSNLFWKLSTTIGDGVYSLRATYYKSDFAGAGYLSLPAMEAGLDPHSTMYDLPGFGAAQRKTLVFNRRPASGEAGWFATAYAEDFERSRAIQTSTTQHTYGYDDRGIYGARGGNTWTFGDAAVLTLGAEARKDKGDAYRQQYRERQPTANYVNNQDLDLLTYGVFVQGQYRVLPTVKLHGGARYDRFDYDLVNLKLPAASTGYKGSVITPKYGAIWNVAPDLELYANIAQGFRSPAAEQISTSGSLGPLGAAGGRINAGIDPSRVRSHDVGFNARPLDGLSVSGAFYTIQNDDEIVNTAPDVFVASGQTTRRGVELDLRYQFSSAFSTYLNYGRILRARLDNPAPGAGARLSVPEHTWKAGVQYRSALGPGRLTLAGDVYVTAGNPYYMGTPLYERDMPTYVRYDVKATYDIGKFQGALFATLQPHKFASDIAYGTAAGLVVTTVPEASGGASLRYFF